MLALGSHEVKLGRNEERVLALLEHDEPLATLGAPELTFVVYDEETDKVLDVAQIALPLGAESPVVHIQPS